MIDGISRAVSKLSSTAKTDTARVRQIVEDVVRSSKHRVSSQNLKSNEH